jgi:tRNA A-37 threonylcarbamoyl transferase component Bud32
VLSTVSRVRRNVALRIDQSTKLTPFAFRVAAPYRLIVLQLLGSRLTDARGRIRRERLRQAMPLCVVKAVMAQLLSGLSYMHSNWILHRDLKPSNILVMGDGPEQVRCILESNML